MAKQQEVLDKLDDLVEALRSRESVTNPNSAKPLGELAERIDKLPDRIAAKVAERVPTSRESSASKVDKSSTARAKNPNASVTRRLDRLEDLRGQRDRVLDAIGDALDALDEGDSDGAEDILDEVLGQFDVDEDDRNRDDES